MTLIVTSGPRPVRSASPVNVPMGMEISFRSSASRLAWASPAISLATMFISGEFACTISMLPASSRTTEKRSSYSTPPPTTAVTAEFIVSVHMALTSATALPMTVGTMLLRK